MDSEELYKNLKRINELEVIIEKKKKLEFGDPHVREYNNLISSIAVLSLEELQEYDGFLMEEIKEEKRKRSKAQKKLKELKKTIKTDIEEPNSKLKKYIEQNDNLRQVLLDKLSQRCTPDAYRIIESTINDVYGSM